MWLSVPFISSVYEDAASTVAAPKYWTSVHCTLYTVQYTGTVFSILEQCSVYWNSVQYTGTVFQMTYPRLIIFYHFQIYIHWICYKTIFTYAIIIMFVLKLNCYSCIYIYIYIYIYITCVLGLKAI